MAARDVVGTGDSGSFVRRLGRAHPRSLLGRTRSGVDTCGRVAPWVSLRSAFAKRRGVDRRGGVRPPEMRARYRIDARSHASRRPRVSVRPLHARHARVGGAMASSAPLCRRPLRSWASVANLDRGAGWWRSPAGRHRRRRSSSRLRRILDESAARGRGGIPHSSRRRIGASGSSRGARGPSGGRGRTRVCVGRVGGRPSDVRFGSDSGRLLGMFGRSSSFTTSPSRLAHARPHRSSGQTVAGLCARPARGARTRSRSLPQRDCRGRAIRDDSWVGVCAWSHSCGGKVGIRRQRDGLFGRRRAGAPRRMGHG